MKNTLSIIFLLGILMSSCVSTKKHQELQSQLNGEQLKTKDQELKVKEVETKNIFLEQNIEDLEAKNKVLNEQIASLKSQLLTVQDSLSSKRGENNEYHKKYQKLLNTTNLENTTNTQALIEKEQTLVEAKKTVVTQKKQYENTLSTQKQQYQKAFNDLTIAKQQEIAILKNQHQAERKKLQEQIIALEIQLTNLQHTNTGLTKDNTVKQERIDELNDMIDSLENFIERKYLGQIKQKLNLLLTDYEKEETQMIAENGKLSISFEDEFLFSNKSTKLVSPDGQIVLAKIAKVLSNEENIEVLIRNDFDKTQNNQDLASSVGSILVRNGIDRFGNINNNTVQLANAKMNITSVILEVN